MGTRGWAIAYGTVATREPSRVSPSRPSGRVSTIAEEAQVPAQLTPLQLEELRHICRESAVARVPSQRYSTGFVGARHPQIAARLYRLGLLKREREGERETVRGPWRYYWTYKPTPEGIAASADTHPKDGDSTEIEAPLVSGAVPERQTPNPSRQDTSPSSKDET
jgi:hypothetical protein